MRLAVSKSLSKYAPDLPVPTRTDNKTYDVTVMLASDVEPWLERSMIRLRPHVVGSIDEGIEVLERYREWENPGPAEDPSDPA